MDIFQKSWKISTPPLKKLLSRTITHQLSRRLNKDNFEVVYEGFLNAHNSLSEQPDIVIYSKREILIPVFAIEICKTEEVLEMIIIAKSMIESYPLKEFFIFDNETDEWIRIDKNGNEIFSSFSPLFSLDLKKLSNGYPHFVRS